MFVYNTLFNHYFAIYFLAENTDGVVNFYLLSRALSILTFRILVVSNTVTSFWYLFVHHFNQFLIHLAVITYRISGHI